MLPFLPRWERGQLGNIDIDGPLALDVAIDKEAAEIKKIKSPVAGDADCLVFPNIESGNVFYKTNTKLANARQGAILVGATARACCLPGVTVWMRS